MQFGIVIEQEKRDQLDALAGLHTAQAEEWWLAGQEAALEIRVPAERRRALVALREERKRRRAAGAHFDTLSALVAYYLRRELEVRGWTRRRWQAVPAGEASMPGRRWGVPNSGVQTAKLQIYLPDPDGELLRRATWNISRRPTERLQELAAIDDLTEALRLERARLRKQIITPPDVIRDAVQAVIDAGPPTD